MKRTNADNQLLGVRGRFTSSDAPTNAGSMLCVRVTSTRSVPLNVCTFLICNHSCFFLSTNVSVLRKKNHNVYRAKERSVWMLWMPAWMKCMAFDAGRMLMMGVAPMRARTTHKQNEAVRTHEKLVFGYNNTTIYVCTFGTIVRTKNVNVQCAHHRIVCVCAQQRLGHMQCAQQRLGRSQPQTESNRSRQQHPRVQQRNRRKCIRRCQHNHRLYFRYEAVP